MKVWTLAVFSLYIAVPAVANFSVATIGLVDLVQRSEVIVVAEVSKIVIRAGVKVAVAKVTQGIKPGSPTGTIEFVADKTWTCDTSNAVVGESVLLYLNKVRKDARVTMLKRDLGRAAGESQAQGRTLYRLAYHGRGRIVVNLDDQGDWIGVKKRFNEDAWTLNVNLFAPKTAKVFKQGRRKRPPAITARMTLRDVIGSTKAAIAAQRKKQLELSALPKVDAPKQYPRFCRNKGP